MSIWTGGDWNQDYNSSSNWDDGVPTTGQTATFDTAHNEDPSSNKFSIHFSTDTILIGGWTFLSGSYDFTLDASETLSFDGAGIVNNGGGATIFNSGDLVFNNASTAGNAVIYTESGGSTVFNGQSNGGDAQFLINAGGVVDIIATTAQNGHFTAGSIEGDGTFKIGDLDLVVGSNGFDTTFSGSIQTGSGNGGSLTKVGTGTLTLSGSNGYTGQTVIDEGALRVHGSITTSSEVVVNDGGMLEGSGATSGVTVNAGGILSPGASAGILVTGSVTFAAGAIFKVELGGSLPGNGYDQLAVVGNVNLGGATLSRALIDNFDPISIAPQLFTIIDNDGMADAVSGTFAGLAQGAKFLIGNRYFTIDYQGGDGNDVVLTSGGALITGTGGANTVSGSTAPAGQHTATQLDDVIKGLGGNDTLYALGGNDMLAGGRGRDTLKGGGGRDLFDFDSIKDSVRGSNRDKILDFQRGADDIDVRTIDAKKGVSGNQKFKFIGKHDFNEVKGELRYEDKGSKVIVQGDVNGDGHADFEIYVKAGALGKGDFLL